MIMVTATKGNRKPYETSLFDSSKFDLDAVFPRSSLVRPAGLLARQPFTAIYLLIVIPVLLLVVPIVGSIKYIYLRLFVKTCPPWSMLDFVVVYLVRVTIMLWWIPTHGGVRGFFHADLKDDQRTWRRHWVGKGAMPDAIAPYPRNRVTGPMRAWMEETRADELKGKVPIWWTGKRAEHLRQSKAGKGEKLLVYLTGCVYRLFA